MECADQSKLQGILRGDVKIQICPGAVIFHFGTPDKGICIPFRCSKLILIPAVEQCEIAENPGRKQMVPAEGVGLVSKSHLGKGIGIYIPSQVTRHKQPVLFIKNMIQLQVQIIEK